MEDVGCSGERAIIREINKNFQVHLSLTEETASADEVQKMLKEPLAGVSINFGTGG